MQRRVLVTGAGGFIGRACVGSLAARGFEIHAVGRTPAAVTDPRAIWHHHDLLAPREPGRLVDAVRPSHLLHLAWYAVPAKYWTAPENVQWVAASTALARAFERAGGERFVSAGSCAEYAPADGDCDERTTALAPSTLYGVSKHAVYREVSELAAGRFSFGWGRIFFLYGPHEDPSRLVPDVIRSLMAGPQALCTAGTQVRDFMHVDDVGDAFAALVDSRVDGAVNVASGRPVRLAEVILSIARQMGAERLVRLGARPMPEGELASITAATARLTDHVGWPAAPAFDPRLA